MNRVLLRIVVAQRDASHRARSSGRSALRISCRKLQVVGHDRGTLRVQPAFMAQKVRLHLHRICGAQNEPQRHWEGLWRCLASSGKPNERFRRLLGPVSSIGNDSGNARLPSGGSPTVWAQHHPCLTSLPNHQHSYLNEDKEVPP